MTANATKQHKMKAAPIRIREIAGADPPPSRYAHDAVGKTMAIAKMSERQAIMRCTALLTGDSRNPDAKHFFNRDKFPGCDYDAVQAQFYVAAN